jgi:hypothetical protein
MPSAKVICCLLILMGSSFAAPAVEAALVRQKVIACREATDLALPMSLAASKIARGACFALLPGAPVSVDQKRLGLFCVRPGGSLDCLWVRAAAIDQYGQISKPTARVMGSPTVFPLIGHPTDPFYHP